MAEVDGKLTRVTVDVTRGADGPPVAVLSVPDERLLSKPLSRLRWEPAGVHFELQAPEQTIVFDGAPDGGGIAGTLRGGNVSAALAFRRVGPVPAPPYTETEVHFRNGDVALAGSLLLPPGPGRHPAVILIHGSSTPSRNDFRFYGDLFARRGIAALIFDKRDGGGGAGGAARYGLRDLAGDALAAVALLKGRDDIDEREIGLWGHSQGGWVAPIAAATSRDVAFVISFSGPGVSYAEVSRYADTARLRAHGATEAEILEATAALAREDDFVRRGGDERELQAFLDDAWSRPWASQTTLPRRVPTVEEIRDELRWRDNDLDPADFWGRIEVPVLVMFGELDDVVPVAASAERIAAALKRAGNRDVTIRIFPKAGHTIQPAPDFLDTMLDWTVRRVKGGPPS
ncbi:MAG: alpha/beta fold hydrolase [Acidobacteria bacterium]|nr:alpha/beta fold hydrolase [Acidobacteriota bacterium]